VAIIELYIAIAKLNAKLAIVKSSRTFTQNPLPDFPSTSKMTRRLITADATSTKPATAKKTIGGSKVFFVCSIFYCAVAVWSAYENLMKELRY